MRLARKFFRFFIYSNLFIAVCAVLMVWQTDLVLLGHFPDINFTGFVFFATICSYSFHWYLTPADPADLSPRIQWLKEYRVVYLWLLVAGVVGAALSSFFLQGHWFWLLTAAFVTFLYSAPKIPNRYFRLLRKVALGKTLFLALTWTYVTSILPLQLSAPEWRPEYLVFASHRFFLIYAVCILFDYRDRENDIKLGIRSLITWLSEKGIRNLFFVSLFAFLISTIGLAAYDKPFLLVACLILPGVLAAWLYPYAIKRPGDLLYYFVLDGLMAFSSLLTLLLPP